MANEKLFSQPHERAVLGSLLADNNLIDTVGRILSDGDFYSADNQRIIKEVKRCLLNDKTADNVTIGHYLNGSVRGEYIESLSDYSINGDTVEEYCHTIKSLADSRRLVDLSKKMENTANKGIKASDVITDFQKKLDHLSSMGSEISTSFRDGFIKELNELDKPSKRYHRVPTGWKTIDRYLDGGLQYGQLDVCAGRTGMGKTSFATGLMINIAKQGVPCLMISIEMPEQQIVRKIISSECRIADGNLVNSDLNQDQWDSLAIKGTEFTKTLFKNVKIDDKSRTLFDVVASIRNHVRKYGTKFVVIDYLQRVKAPQRDARYLEVGEVVDDLADLAKRLDINIMTVSQISRAVETNGNSRPRISHLSESGKIEEAASRILLMYRDEYYNEDSKDVGMCEINIAKNRFGETKTVKLAFVKEFTLFGDLI